MLALQLKQAQPVPPGCALIGPAAVWAETTSAVPFHQPSFHALEPKFPISTLNFA
jgi:hypothetical protein